MSVYMILDAEVHDPVEYEKYKAATRTNRNAKVSFERKI